jgi:hypothetical protein
MISHTTHELIKDQIEYLCHLEDCRKKAYNEFMEYLFKIDAQKESIEELKKRDSVKSLLEKPKNVI